MPSDHDIFDSFDPTAHAEITTIREFCKQQKIRECSGYEMYITSEPCPMCLAAIYRTCFDKVYYCNTLDDDEECKRIDKKIYQELAASPAMRKIKCIHISSEKGKDLLNERNAHIQNRPDLKNLTDTQRNNLS